MTRLKAVRIGVSLTVACFLACLTSYIIYRIQIRADLLHIAKSIGYEKSPQLFGNVFDYGRNAFGKVVQTGRSIEDVDTILSAIPYDSREIGSSRDQKIFRRYLFKVTSLESENYIYLYIAVDQHGKVESFGLDNS